MALEKLSDPNARYGARVARSEESLLVIFSERVLFCDEIFHLGKRELRGSDRTDD